uniref:Putative secreted protein n=1 Tax=Anopheles darlingi TaxID=43151 RepID=A0A2M4DHV9_ANODA
MPVSLLLRAFFLSPVLSTDASTFCSTLATSPREDDERRAVVDGFDELGLSSSVLLDSRLDPKPLRIIRSLL